MRCGAALALFCVTGVASGAGDAMRGAQLFRQCAACHSTVPGEHMTGPSLAHVWNRKAGSVDGFKRYSDALRAAGVTWNEATLDKWIGGPEQFIPGSAMTFPGVRGDRASIVFSSPSEIGEMIERSCP